MKSWIVLFVLIASCQTPAMAESLNCAQASPACVSYCQNENAAKQKFDALWNLPQIQRNNGAEMSREEEQMLSCHAYKGSAATINYLRCEQTHHPDPKARQTYAAMVENQQQFQKDQPIFQDILKAPAAQCSKSWASPIPAKR